MKNNVIPPPLARPLAKSLAVLFILFFLFCETMENFHIALPPPDNGPNFQNSIYRGFLALIQNTWNLGVDLSIAEHWTMYSFSYPFDSQLLILGIKQDGRGVVLPVPTQIPRNALESNLIDYHENKLLEGCFRYPELQSMVAKSMCRLYARKFDLKAIMFVEVVRKILPREESEKLHRYYGDSNTQSNCGMHTCSD